MAQYRDIETQQQEILKAIEAEKSKRRYMEEMLPYCDEDEICNQIARLPEDLRTPEMALQLRLANAEENRRKKDQEIAMLVQAGCYEEPVQVGRYEEPLHEYKVPVPGYVPTPGNRPAFVPMAPKPIASAFEPVLRSPANVARQPQERKRKEEKNIEDYQTPERQRRVVEPSAPRKQTPVWAPSAPVLGPSAPAASNMRSLTKDEMPSAAAREDLPWHLRGAALAAQSRLDRARHRSASDRNVVRSGVNSRANALSYVNGN